MHRVQVAKGVRLPGEPPLVTAAAGMEWIERLYRPHGFTLDDYMAVSEFVADTTVANVVRMVERGVLSSSEGVLAGVGSGVGNGLIVGMEVKDPHVI